MGAEKSGRVKVGRWGHPSSDPARPGPAWPGYGTRGVMKRIVETGEEGTLNRRQQRRDQSDRGGGEKGGRVKSKGEGLGK